MTLASRSKILTIMMVDIVDYTKLSSSLGREKFDELNENFDRISLPLFEKYAGKVIKKMGDAFIVVFESATDSLHCAIDLQNKFWEYNESRAGTPIKIKIALNTGEVLIREGDIYGESVNIASRVEKITKPGQIFFTHPVFLAMNKNEIPFLYLGRKKVKGIEYLLKIFRVKGVGEERKKWKLGGFGWLTAVIFDLLIMLFWIAIMGGIIWFVYRVLVVSGYWDRIIDWVRLIF
jgi:class 3 adenylate cyclase